MGRDAVTRLAAVRWVLLVVLVVVNVALFSHVRGELDESVSQDQLAARAPSPVASPPAEKVTVVGDEQGPPALVVTGQSTVLSRAAAELPWQAEVVSAPTSTFTTPAGDAPGDLFRVIRARESLVEYRHIVIQGGLGNVETDPDRLRTALLHLLDEVSAKVGSGVTITLMGPLPSEGAGPTRVDLALRDAVQARGIVYVDPVARGWTLEDEDLVDQVADALAEAARLDRGPAASADPGAGGG
jgi:hypothetical protein